MSPVTLNDPLENVQNALYGGKMTASRIREVVNVTGEALEGIHKFV